MKKTKLLIALFGYLFLSIKSEAVPVIDALTNVDATPSQINLSYNVTASSLTTELSVYRRITGTTNLQTVVGWQSVPVGSSFGPIFSTAVMQGTSYDHILVLRDTVSSDSVFAVITTVTPVYVPADVFNLNAFFPDSSTQLLTVQYDMGWSTGQVVYQYSPNNGNNWYNISGGIHGSLSGYSVDSLNINQQLGTTFMYRVLSSNNHFPGDIDTSNVYTFTTISPIYPVTISQASFQAPTAFGAMLDYTEYSDSGGTTVVIYRTDAPIFQQGAIDTIIYFSGTGIHQANIWIDGYGPLTSTYVWVITTNAFSADTSLMLSFSTTAGMPTISVPQVVGYDNFALTVDLESVIAINDVLATVYFDLANQSDTSLILQSSTAVINGGTNIYWASILLNSPGCYRVQGVIYNSVGIAKSNFSAPFCVGTMTGIPDKVLTGNTQPHRVVIFDISGRLVKESFIGNENELIQKFKSSGELPAGIYFLKSEFSSSKFLIH